MSGKTRVASSTPIESANINRCEGASETEGGGEVSSAEDT